MNHAFDRTKLLLKATLALTAAGILLRTLSLYLAFDTGVGYFLTRHALPILTTILLAAAPLLAFAFSFLYKKDIAFAAPGNDAAAVLVGQGICGVCCFVCAFMVLLRGSYVGASRPLLLVTFVATILGSLYFLGALLFKDPGHSLLWFGYAAILAATLLIAITYFDRYTPMNAPHKLDTHIALLSLMLATLFEIGVVIGKGTRLYVVFLTVATFLCGTIGVSNLLATFGGVFKDPVYLAVDLFLLGFFLHFLLTIIAALKPSAKEATPPVPAEETTPDE